MRVSRVGLGCGGHSRLGMTRGATEEQAGRVVRAAVGLGVNVFDTAESYGTEGAVRRGLEGVDRGSVVLSTKAAVREGWDGERRTGVELRKCLEASLRKLGTEYVDVYHLHGVSAEEYGYARDELRGEVERFREEGKVRWAGITEAFGSDTGHAMLARAVTADAGKWDVVMVGHNVLNFSARERVLVGTRAAGVGTLCMFAVRRAMSDMKVLREVVRGLIERGEVRAEEVDAENPLEFLSEGGASVVEAAYRFCGNEEGMDVVLTGTGDVGHLRENVGSILGDRLGEAVMERLGRVFGGVHCVSGN